MGQEADDGDGIPADDGVPGYSPCSGGATTSCDDNAPFDWNPDQVDTDSDGVGDVWDCAPTDATVSPYAIETNDGEDQNCPGGFGHGLIDEMGVDSGFKNPNDPNEYSWTSQAGATMYEVVRSTTPRFDVGVCTLYATEIASWTDLSTPDVGEGYYYLNRAVSPFSGSWGAVSGGAQLPPGFIPLGSYEGALGRPMECLNSAK